MAQDFRLLSRSGSGRIVELCARCRDAEGGRKDKAGGMFVDRNRLSFPVAPRVRRLPETDIPNGVGFLFTFKERGRAKIQAWRYLFRQRLPRRGMRRLPETNIPNGAGFSSAFVKRQRVHSRSMCALPRQRRRARRQARQHVCRQKSPKLGLSLVCARRMIAARCDPAPKVASGVRLRTPSPSRPAPRRSRPRRTPRRSARPVRR